MKTMHAQWLTLHKTDIDQDTSIEILWQTAPNTLHVLILRISRDGTRASLTSEEIGPYHCLADLRQQLCMLFGEPAAQRIGEPSSWLPPGIPVSGLESLRRSTSATPSYQPQELRQWPALATPPSSHLAMTDVQQPETIQPVSSDEHWTEVASH
jgi:hypothetical protein